jgi:large subunit ribosomal protein LP2
MKYLAAYALCWLGGNKDPSPSDLKNVLNSIGAEFENSEAEFVCKNLNGKSLDEIVEEGSTRL